MVGVLVKFLDNQGDLTYFKSPLGHNGSIDYAQQRAKSLADQAQRGFQEHFSHLDSPSALIAKSIFSNLIRFIIERQH